MFVINYRFSVYTDNVLNSLSRFSAGRADGVLIIAIV